MRILSGVVLLAIATGMMPGAAGLQAFAMTHDPSIDGSIGLGEWAGAAIEQVNLTQGFGRPIAEDDPAFPCSQAEASQASVLVASAERGPWFFLAIQVPHICGGNTSNAWNSVDVILRNRRNLSTNLTLYPNGRFAAFDVITDESTKGIPYNYPAQPLRDGEAFASSRQSTFSVYELRLALARIDGGSLDMAVRSHVWALWWADPTTDQGWLPWELASTQSAGPTPREVFATPALVLAGAVLAAGLRRRGPGLRCRSCG